MSLRCAVYYTNRASGFQVEVTQMTYKDLFEGKKPDNQGSPVSVTRMDPRLSYFGVPDLLRVVIDKNDEEAWMEIRRKIDYTYKNIDKMLQSLSKESDFLIKIRMELEKGKLLLFKPNLVSPTNIDPDTHGPGLGHTACTEWPFIAALMRWFHDNIPLSYSRMSLGEAASVSSMVAGMYNHASHPEKKITTEAVFEGRSGDFYGGWGFYYVRRYLRDTASSPDDDPMLGYEESISGIYLPPGKTRGRMMVYDLNKLNDVKGKARTVPVKDGVNYHEITLPKVVVGGDPGDPEDLKDYPGAVLVNVPRLKLHSIDLITNAIKNLGIGLYPMEIGETDEPEDTHWKYSHPFKEIPGMKTEIPHSVWVPEFDEGTGLPIKGEDGHYRLRKTGGIGATQTDVIRATMDQGVYILHVVDAIQTVNINHTGDPSAKEVPEGLSFASENPVALDLLCARYVFKNVPRREASDTSLESDFLQKVPSPKIEGGNIVSGETYDSPLLRYNLYSDAEKRGLGSQLYHVVGWDDVERLPLASVDGHLGSFRDSGFKEVMTTEFYHNPTNLLWGLQRTAFDYLRSNDDLTRTSYMRKILEAYDENGDGWVSYDEMGRDAFWHTYLRLAAYCYHLRGHSELGSLKSSFTLASLWRYADPLWNIEGHDFMKNFKIATDFSLAYALSKSPKRNTDPLHPSMFWGQGNWPSMDFAGLLSTMMRIFGEGYPNRVSLYSLYGYAFQYADKKQANGRYTGSTTLYSDPESLDKYLKDAEDVSHKLRFKVYVPKGFGKMDKIALPHLEETSDPAKIFTADFPDENWDISSRRK